MLGASNLNASNLNASTSINQNIQPFITQILSILNNSSTLNMFKQQILKQMINATNTSGTNTSGIKNPISIISTSSGSSSPFGNTDRISAF